MKILLLAKHNFYFIKGGAEFQTILLSLNFSKKKHICKYIFEYPQLQYFSKKVNIKNKKGDKYYLLSSRVKHSFFYKLKNLITSIREFKPDVIYQRGFDYYSIILPFLSSQIKKVLHISADDEVRPYNVLFGKIGKSFFFKNFDQIIVQNHDQQNFLMDNYSINSSKINNILPSFQGNFTPYNQRKYITWIANLKDWKRPNQFIKLAKLYGNDDKTFLMIGRPFTDKSKHHSFLSKINHSNNVKYLGELKPGQVLQYLQESLIFVNTSDLKEGFPNTFIQSASVGTPIFSRLVNPSGIINKMNLGFVNNDLHKLVEEIRVMSVHENRWNAISTNCIEYVKKEHNVEKIINEMEDIFSKTIKK